MGAMLLRQALRFLRKSPGYVAACVVVLALGIGANAAIFTLLYDAMLKPLPYPDAERLVLMYSGFPSLPAPMSNHMPVSRPLYEEWRRQASSFDGVAAFYETNFRENGVDQPRVLRTALVAANFLPLLGATVEAGRLFRGDEETPGKDFVVVLSDRYFEQRFRRDPGAIGQTIKFGGASYAVIGVLDKRFDVPATGLDSQGQPDVYIPLSRAWTRPEVDRMTALSVAARLRPGVGIDRARAEMRTITERLHQSDMERFPIAEANVFSFRDERQSEDLNRALYVLLGAVALVLLTGCANLANLTLARASGRTREIAVRRALGASRADIVRQLLTESMILSVAGAILGLLIASWVTKGMLALAPSDAIRPGMGELSIPVFLFAAAVAGLTVLLFGLAPAISVSGVDLNTGLKAGGRSGSAAGQRTRRFLIAAEVAMALVLITGAGLLLRSFANVIETDLGFETERLVAVDLDLPEAEYPDAPARARLLENILERARAMPGASAAAMSDTLPLHRVTMTSFEIVGRPPLPPGEFITADSANLLPGYLEILRVLPVAGRPLTANDVTANRGTGDSVVIVNRAFVDKYLPSVDPLQQRLEIGGRVYQIVGVTANFRALGAEEDVRPQFFRPGIDGESAILLVKSRVALDALTADIRNLLGSIDERLSTAHVKTMEEYVDQWLEIRWFGLALIGIFAGLALTLAMVGVHSVLANLVASRTREIGIRMALGATPARIARLIAGQSLRPVLFGLGVGLLASVSLGRLIGSMLFRVPPYDPVTFALSIAAILAVTPLAIWLPIRRATRVESTEALRAE
jgi:predicted permease